MISHTTLSPPSCSGVKHTVHDSLFSNLLSAIIWNASTSEFLISRREGRRHRLQTEYIERLKNHPLSSWEEISEGNCWAKYIIIVKYLNNSGDCLCSTLSNCFTVCDIFFSVWRFYDATYCFMGMSRSRLSFHFKSLIKSFCSTFGWQVRTNDFPTGLLCSLCDGRISSRFSCAP